MSETKITKETKQEIALNYATDKVSKLNLALIEVANKLTNEIRTATLSLNDTNSEELTELISKVNAMQCDDVKNSFFSNSFRLQTIDSLPLKVTSIQNRIANSSNGDNVIFYYIDVDKDYSKKRDVKINHHNFNYQRFQKHTQEELYSNPAFAVVANEFISIREEYKKALNIAYSNCYELIKNIRTLERLEKKFLDVHKYLPIEIKTKEDKESILQGFKDL